MAREASSKFPYTVGAVFAIREHTPPSIEDAEAGKAPTFVSQEPEDIRPSLPRGEFKHPPHQLKITDTVMVRDEGRDAQIILCQISPGLPHVGSRQLVAKIWDPLYRCPYPYETSLTAAELALVDYSHETTAYAHIAASRHPPPWPCTPQYHGSWSLQCPQLSSSVSSSAGPSTRSSRNRRANEGERPKFRTVFLVLLEHVQGCPMSSLLRLKNGGRFSNNNEAADPWEYRCSEEYRLYAGARVLEILSWMDFIGLNQNDLAYRNIIVSPAPVLSVWPQEGESSVPALEQLTPSNRPSRVAVIDFNLADINETQLWLLSQGSSSQPRNPIDKYWSSKYCALSNWLPKWVKEDLPRRRE